MSTLLDVIAGSLTALGQLGQGQTANAEDGALGLRLANLLLTQKSTERLFIYNVTPVIWILTPNVQDYTWGPSGATFNGPRPAFVESAQVQPAGTSMWLPVSILDKTKWDAIRNLGASTPDVPDDVWVEYTYPNLTFHVNPISSSAPKMRFGTWQLLQQFASLFEVLALPPAYEEFLESNLAIMLGPYYDQPIPPDLEVRAQRAEAQVMKINAQGLGGALSAGQKFDTPNLGQPILPGGPPAPAAPAQ